MIPQNGESTRDQDQSTRSIILRPTRVTPRRARILESIQFSFLAFCTHFRQASLLSKYAQSLVGGKTIGSDHMFVSLLFASNAPQRSHTHTFVWIIGILLSPELGALFPPNGLLLQARNVRSHPNRIYQSGTSSPQEMKSHYVVVWLGKNPIPRPYYYGLAHSFFDRPSLLACFVLKRYQLPSPGHSRECGGGRFSCSSWQFV